MYGYIYKITNNVNNKIYIGQTKNTIEQRFKGHIKQAKANKKSDHSILHEAIRKYGELNFYVEEIDFANTKNELDEKEKYWIKNLNAQNSKIGYNIMPGGEGVDFYSLSIETQNKKKQFHSKDTSNRRWYTNGVDNKYINKYETPPDGYYPGRTFNTTNIGKYVRTEEHKKSLRGRISPTKGKHLSEEQKQHLRKINLGKKYSDEINKKKGKSRKGPENPAYGSHYKWLTNGENDIRIYEKDYNKLNDYYNQGYYQGRSNKLLFKGSN